MISALDLCPFSSANKVFEDCQGGIDLFKVGFWGVNKVMECVIKHIARRLFKGRVETPTDKSLEDKGSGEKGGSTANQVSTARPEVCTASIPVNVRVAFRDVKEPPRLTRSTTTLQPLPTIDPKDKDLAQRINEEELAELDRAQKEKQKQEEATIAALTEEFDKIQARLDADHELAIRMIREEQEKYTIRERARLLAEYFKRRKKQLAS
nr:hypothetical protein [Tanacetum cinerariifolium]